MSSRRKEESKSDLELGEGTGVFSDDEDSLPSMGERISAIPTDLPFKNLITNNYGNPAIGQSEDSISSEEVDDDNYMDRDDRQASANMGIIGDRSMKSNPKFRRDIKASLESISEEDPDIESTIRNTFGKSEAGNKSKMSLGKKSRPRNSNKDSEYGPSTVLSDKIGSINITEEKGRLTLDQIPYRIDLEQQKPIDLLSNPSQHRTKGK